MKVGIDHADLISKRWGQSFPRGETILAAELVMPRGHVRHGVGWVVPEAIGSGLGLPGQVAGTLLGRVGESAASEAHRHRRNLDKGQAARFPDFPVVLAVTNRRYLLFQEVRDGFKHWFDPISSQPKNWIHSLEVTPSVLTHKLNLQFSDGTTTRLQMTRGLGDPRNLMSAIATLRSTFSGDSRPNPVGDP